jgi:peptidoglycan/LPS O-acetylase OafA/YrhL
LIFRRPEKAPTMTATAPLPTGAARRHDIDTLRGIAVLLLIPFHTAMLFAHEPWHVKDAGRYVAADLIVSTLNVIHMPLLFALAGASMLFSLQHRSWPRFLGERVTRLLIPLVAGILIVVPPQVYVERLSAGMPDRFSPIDWSGSYGDFYPTFFTCCYTHGNFSWHHLWFLVYLLFYSILVLPLAVWLARRFRATPADAKPWLGGWRILIPLVPLVLTELYLRPIYGSTHALQGDRANHVAFLTVIIAGMIVFARAPDIAAMKRDALPLSAVALACFALWLILWRFGIGPREPKVLLRVAACWIGIAALAGVFARWVDRPLPFLTWFAPYSLAFYIIHQTVIVLAGYVWRDWSSTPLVKAIVIAALATGISLAIAWGARLTPPTRLILGLTPPRRPAPPSAPRPSSPPLPAA